MQSWLVVFPLKNELDFVLSRFASQGLTIVAGQTGRLKVSYVPQIQLILAQGGHGKAQMAAQTQYLAGRLPHLMGVVCAGSCGALHGQLAVGDIVVAEKTVEHDFRLKFVRRDLPSFVTQAAKVRERFLKLRLQPQFKVHFGTMASGDEDIVEATRSQEIRAATGAIAVAWEGAGAARAAQLAELPFNEIRAVTDFADNPSIEMFTQNLKGAMENLAEILITLYKTDDK